MKIIGLTGGIGSGKSTILTFFKEMGAAVFIADEEAKKLMNTNEQLINEISSLFGEKAYLNNTLNREYIASVVFNDPDKLQQLNKIVHPRVREHFLMYAKNCPKEMLVYEAAILYESGSDSLCDYVVVVIADLKDRIARVVKRDNVSKESVNQRIQHQSNDIEKVKKANFVVRNKELLMAKIQVETLFNLILAENINCE